MSAYPGAVLRTVTMSPSCHPAASAVLSCTQQRSVSVRSAVCRCSSCTSEAPCGASMVNIQQTNYTRRMHTLYTLYTHQQPQPHRRRPGHLRLRFDCLCRPPPRGSPGPGSHSNLHSRRQAHSGGWLAGRDGQEERGLGCDPKWHALTDADDANLGEKLLFKQLGVAFNHLPVIDAGWLDDDRGGQGDMRHVL